VVLRFEVTDSGIGIVPEQRERLFQSFSQADASTTRRYGGTGLGLTISKQLVELMEGEIGVESEPGVGSTFWFTVPLKKQPEETPKAPRPFVADLRALRVMIVDDNATNRQILNTQIAPWSMHSESAEDGPKALQILRAAAERGSAYDLAILDMQMPGMDGIQLARAVKADPVISATRLILLPSVSKRGDGEEAREAGIEAYLSKPVKQSELYDTIATVMGTPAEAETPREKQLVTRHSLRETRARLLPRVLVAEDNPVNQKVARVMLEKVGYRVDVVANGIEALEALSQRSYAAVLMDVQMPEMGGYEATAEIRRCEEPENRHTPIIAMTANALQGERKKALEAGMDDYISKPVKREELGEILKRWVQ
jgi:CheY-like chemotaxis protein